MEMIYLWKLARLSNSFTIRYFIGTHFLSLHFKSKLSSNLCLVTFDAVWNQQINGSIQNVEFNNKLFYL